MRVTQEPCGDRGPDKQARDGQPPGRGACAKGGQDREQACRQKGPGDQEGRSGYEELKQERRGEARQEDACPGWRHPDWRSESHDPCDSRCSPEGDRSGIPAENQGARASRQGEGAGLQSTAAAGRHPDGQEQGAEPDQKDGDLPHRHPGEQVPLLQKAPAVRCDASREMENGPGEKDQVDCGARTPNDSRRIQHPASAGVSQGQGEETRAGRQDKPAREGWIGDQEVIEGVREGLVRPPGRKGRRERCGEGDRGDLVAHVLEASCIQISGRGSRGVIVELSPDEGEVQSVDPRRPRDGEVRVIRHGGIDQDRERRRRGMVGDRLQEVDGSTVPRGGLEHLRKPAAAPRLHVDQKADPPGEWVAVEEGLRAQQPRLFAVGHEKDDVALRRSMGSQDTCDLQRRSDSGRVVRRTRRVSDAVIMRHQSQRRRGAVTTRKNADDVLNGSAEKDGIGGPRRRTAKAELCLDLGFEPGCGHSLKNVVPHASIGGRPDRVGFPRDHLDVGLGPRS